MLDGQDVVGDLGCRVQGRADNFVGFDGLLSVECETNCVESYICWNSKVILLTILPPIHRLSQMHLRSLCRNKADETSPLLGNNVLSASLCVDFVCNNIRSLWGPWRCWREWE